MARDTEKDSGDGDDDQPVTDPNRDQISTSLKRVYNDVASEPLPDKLVDLLNSIKKGDSK